MIAKTALNVVIAMNAVAVVALVGIVALVAEVVLVNVVLEGAAARGRAVMVPEGRHVEIVVMARAEVRVVSAIVTVAAKEAVISVPSVSGCRSRRTSR